MAQILTTQQLLDSIKDFKWTRKIAKIHPHHTHKPSHKDFNGKNGLELVENMRNYHMKTKRYQDIAQNITLLPNGLWVLGRNWNDEPASQLGNNTGAFMVEMIGSFNKGADKLTGKQLESIIEWCAFCNEFFKLPISAIQFHREHGSTACPGTGISKDWFVGLVKAKIEDNKKPAAPKKYVAKYPLPTGVFSEEKRKVQDKAAVMKIQNALNALKDYPCGKVDGDYGPKTKSAVLVFQRASKLEADGVYGPQTKIKLAEALKRKGL